MKISKNYIKKSGIYCIENIVNNKKYIGSSLNIYNRLHKHRTLLTKNKHENIILQNSVNKHDINKFICYILEETSDLLKKEQYWVNILNPNYNIIKEVTRNTLPKESRLKISDTLKRKYKNGETISLSKKSINVFLVSGEFYKSFNSIKECSQELNIHTSSILRVLKNTYKQAKGFIFTYSNIIEVDPILVGKSGKAFVDRIDMNIKSIQFSSTIETLTFKSFKEASQYFNVTSTTISQAKKLGKYKGYIVTLPAPR